MAPADTITGGWVVTKNNVYCYDSTAATSTFTITCDNGYVTESTDATSCEYVTDSETGWVSGKYYRLRSGPTYTLYRTASVVAAPAGYAYWPPPREETPEEKAAREKREAEEAERRRKVEKRAKKLLLDVIGADEYRKFKRKGYIDVKGPTGVLYRLRPGQKIDVVESQDKVSYRLCLVYDNHKIPSMDLLVQEYLLLTSGQEGEEFIHKTAKRWAA